MSCYKLQYDRFNPHDPLKLSLDSLNSVGCCVNGNLNEVFFLLDRLKLTMNAASYSCTSGFYHHYYRTLTNLGEVKEIIQNLKGSVGALIDDAGELDSCLNELDSMLPNFVKDTDVDDLYEDEPLYEKGGTDQIALGVHNVKDDKLPF